MWLIMFSYCPCNLGIIQISMKALADCKINTLSPSHDMTKIKILIYKCANPASVLQTLKVSWKNTPPSWDKSSDPCGFPWEGVQCTGARVTSLWVLYCSTFQIVYDLHTLVIKDCNVAFLSTHFWIAPLRSAFIYRRLSSMGLKGELSSYIEGLTELNSLWVWL